MTAADGAEALALYAKHRPEIAVVLTDMRMPVMDGTAMIDALLPMDPSVRIIAASGLDMDDHIAKLTSTGVRHFLDKPYTPASLLKVLRAVLDEK